MEKLTILLTLFIPATLVLLAMYLVVRSFVNKELEKASINSRLKLKEQLVPTRLQAYERMALYLERISPQNLILRVNESNFNVAMLQQRLLSDLREEYNHNISQQLYMSEKLWNQIKAAQENTITIINQCADQLDKEAPSIELAKTVFNHMATVEQDQIMLALSSLKKEVQLLF